MRRVPTSCLVFVLLVTLFPRITPGAGQSDQRSLAARAKAGMHKAGMYWAHHVASHGGYVWEYSTDLVTRRRGESGDLPSSTNWVQPPGTPTCGMTFLKAYEATHDSDYLDAAVAVAHCLAWGQLASGGWTYSIEFDLSRNRNRYLHLNPKATKGYDRLRNTTTFDDNTTQSATRLLMAVDQYVDDPVITAAVDRALSCFLQAQYKEGKWDGAWPQRFPPPKGYGAFPTFNDNTMSDCVRTMLVAARQYNDPRYMASVKRCLEFYLRAQLAAPQSTWAQQYDERLRPAAARRFEPVAVTGGESSGNMDLLMDMYIEFGDRRYLEAVGRAASWYESSRIGGTKENGIWARFYELETNRPLYFTRTYELVYTDDDLPVHYSFKGNYGVNSRIRRFQQITKRGRDYFLDRRDRKPTSDQRAATAKHLASSVETILKQLDDQGRWVRTVAKREQVRDKEGRVGYEEDPNVQLHMMYSTEFCQNVNRLADYLIAVQE